MNWTDLTIAIVGGDEREQEIARLAAATGAFVRAYGFPWPESGIAGVKQAADARAALDGADFALFPIPGLTSAGSLFATEPIVPDRDLLAVLKPGAHIILGTADDGLKAAAAAHGIVLHEYETDTELMLLRMPAIVEGAIKIVIENTPVTIHGSEVAVVGYGNIGHLLTRTLVLLGARVHLFARNPVQRADAHTIGARPHPIEALESAAPSLDILLSTVPAPVVGPAVLDALPSHAFVADLSAPPGGVDLDHARAIGLGAVWARALGRCAPITVGASQWKGIAERIERIERNTGEKR